MEEPLVIAAVCGRARLRLMSGHAGMILCAAPRLSPAASAARTRDGSSRYRSDMPVAISGSRQRPSTAAASAG
jgi:hypothetical protein